MNSSLFESNIENSSHQSITTATSESFRDALVCHVYMLYSILSGFEMSVKHNNVIHSNNSNNRNARNEMADFAIAREMCAMSMLQVARAIAEKRFLLWKHGVPDEDVIALPCRVAYLMLENSKNATLRKNASGDAALEILTTTFNTFTSNDSSLGGSSSVINTIVGALVDLLHSFDHIAPIVAEMCCKLKTKESSKLLASELLRGFGRMDVPLSSTTDNSNSNNGKAKASGVNNFAPFISELALKRPNLVLDSISFILPLLSSEAYQIRSSVVTALGYILASDLLLKKMEDNNDIVAVSDQEQGTIGKNNYAFNNDEEEKQEHDLDIYERDDAQRLKTQQSLLDVLEKRVYDNTSFTRSATMKSWAYIICNDALPLDRVQSVTKLAIDRLQDKSVYVRRTAIQVCSGLYFDYICESLIKLF